MGPVFLHVGGLVAVGFDPTGRFLLTVSHAGRGLFDTSSWRRVARDPTPAYPEDGVAKAIGPIAGQRLAVIELDHATETLNASCPAGRHTLRYAEGTITVRRTDP